MPTRKGKGPQLVRSVRWVPAVQELPDDSLLVLVHGPAWDEPVGMGFYDSESACWRSLEVDRVPGVNHWANLPDAP